jgi:adenylate cyclase
MRLIQRGATAVPGIFVSYARSTEREAEQVGAALQSLGYEVWRDDQLPAHRSYGDVIEEPLRAAGAVIVLWSVDAARSQWVRAEADAARQAGTLVQVTVDGAVPPLPFNQIQCADLKGWEGDFDAPGWKKVTSSVAALMGDGIPPTGQSPSPRNIKPKSICVLPFANMSGDAEQEYFSDGISEDITTDLSKVSALAVTARNTAFMFKGQSIDVCDVARKLGVSHVLEGRVRKAGARVRITAQLIDGASGDHLWAERYDRDLTDIFAIQDEISKAIVAALKLKLLPEEKKAIEQRGTTNAEAYNLYLMARQYWVTGNHGDPKREERVVRLCRRAVEIDPNYAQAWALMALAQASLRYAFNRQDEDALVSAEQALSLDPNIAEAHSVKARVSSEAGDWDRANAQIALALQLDPESWEVRKEAARICMAQRMVPEAATHYEKTVSLIESDYHSWAMLVTCHQALGNHEGVAHGAQMMLSQSEKVLAHDPSNGAALGICAGGLAILGETERAKERIQRALLIDPDNLNMRYNFACVLAGYCHDVDGALLLLERVFAEARGTLISNAVVDPDLDILRGNPKFEEMLANARKRAATDLNPAVT